LREGLLIKVVSLGNEPVGDQDPSSVEVVEESGALV